MVGPQPLDPLPLPIEQIERLRDLGYAVVPFAPTRDMARVGAPSCFIVPDGSFETACDDAAECYRAMVELGSL